MPNVNDFLAWTRPSRVLPQAVVDASIPGIVARASRYGELLVSPVVTTKHNLTEEGSYFVYTNPTPGTVLAYGAAGTQAAFSDTVPFMILQNLDAVGGKRICLDYLKLIQIGGTAPATTTSVQAACKVDLALRTPTAGTTTTLVAAQPNGDVSGKSIGSLIVASGAVATIPAASANARLVGRAQLKGGPTLVLDEYAIAFGMVDAPPQGGYLTTVSSYVTRMPPCEVPPGGSAVIYLWLPGGATNPFSYEFELGAWER